MAFNTEAFTVNSRAEAQPRLAAKHNSTLRRTAFFAPERHPAIVTAVPSSLRVVYAPTGRLGLIRGQRLLQQRRLWKGRPSLRRPDPRQTAAQSVQAWRDTPRPSYGKLLDRNRKLVEVRLDGMLKTQRQAVDRIAPGPRRAGQPGGGPPSRANGPPGATHPRGGTRPPPRFHRGALGDPMTVSRRRGPVGTNSRGATPRGLPASNDARVAFISPLLSSRHKGTMLAVRHALPAPPLPGSPARSSPAAASPGPRSPARSCRA